MNKNYFLLLSLTLCTIIAQGQFSLTIFHNNDGESKLVNAGEGFEDYGGVARFKTLLDSLRVEASNAGNSHITLSSGDNYLAGTAFTAGLNRASGLPLYDSEALGALDYDAICLGNHDFDFGPEVLARLVGEVNDIEATPFLSSNLDFSAESSLQSHVTAGRIAASTTVTVNGNDIGIIGATTQSLASISSPGAVGIDPDIAGAVQDEVDALETAGVDVIILISHLQGLEEDTALIASLTGIDVVIAGGGAELLGSEGTPLVPIDTAGGNTFLGPYPLVVEDENGDDVYVVTTPGEYKYIGRLTLDFDGNGNITSVDTGSSLVRVAAEDGIASDPDLLSDVVEPIAEYQANLASNIIATTEIELDGLRTSVRSKETNYGNLISDALLWTANENAADFGLPEAHVAIQNGGGIRNNTILPTGNYSELATFQALPFSNFVGIVEDITPARFKEIMENSVSALAGGANDGSGRFAQVAGFTIHWDSLRPSLEYDLEGNVVTEGERIWSITLHDDDSTQIVSEGNLVDGAPNINLAVVNFTAGGGDQYPLADLNYTPVGVTYQRALYNYIVEELNGTISTAMYPEGGEGRIVVGGALGISDASLKNGGFNLYPNPASEVLYLQFSEMSAQEKTMRIIDIAGRVVHERTIQNNAQLVEVSIDGYNEGAYLIQISDKDSGTHVQKFLVH